MAETFSPIIYEETTKTHQPAAKGLSIDPSHILIERAPENILTNGDDGLAVKLANFVSTKDDNVLSVQDGKLYVKDKTVDVLPSEQDGNVIRLGNDGRLFADGNDILSNGSENLIVINAIDKKIELTAEKVAAALKTSQAWSAASADTGNLIRTGSDHGALLIANDVLSNDSENLLSVNSTDNKITLTPKAVADKVKSLTLSQQDGNYARLGSDGGIFLDGNDVLSNGTENILRIDPIDKKVTLSKQTIIDTLKGDMNWSPVSTDDKNLIYKGTDQGAYVAGQDLISRNAGNMIDVGSDGKLLVSPATITDGLISADGNNALTLDSHGRLYVRDTSKDSPVSADAKNLIYDGSDHKAYVTGADLVSHNDGNMLFVGTDAKLMFNADMLVSMAISAQPGNAIQAGADGRLYAKDVSSMTPQQLNMLSDNTGNALRYGSDGKLYIGTDLGTM